MFDEFSSIHWLISNWTENIKQAECVLETDEKSPTCKKPLTKSHSLDFNSQNSDNRHFTNDSPFEWNTFHFGNIQMILIYHKIKQSIQLISMISLSLNKLCI